MSIFNLLAGYNYDIRSAIQALVSVIGGGGGGGGGSTIVPTSDSTTTSPVVVVAAAGTQIFNSRSLVGTASLVAATHRWWGAFMNAWAVWIPGGGGPGQSIDLNITVNFPGTGLYRFAYGGDDTGFIQIDGVQVITGGGNIFNADGALYNINVTGGNRVLRCYVVDGGGAPTGFALTITVVNNITAGGVTTTIPGTKSPGGGGGGAGQAVSSSPEIKAGITYTVTVGSGGAGGSSTTSSAGTAGGLSSISGAELNTISAAGGSGGAGPPSSTNGGNGGASGGSAFAGGTGASTGGKFGGGGGGAGGVGGSGTSTSQPAGGSGVTLSYSVNTLGTGGAGGGVIGLSQVNGTANRGIGGQGGGYGYNGGSGGSGTVLISTSPYYFLSYTAGVPSAVAKTTYDSRDVYTFTASTSIIFSSTVTLTGFAVTPSSIVFGAAAPTITVPNSNYPLGSIQYTSSNPAVATINQTTGAIAIISAGTTNLSATNIVPSPLVNVSQTVTLTVVPDAGHQLFTTPGSFNWTVPAGVTSVCVVCVGGGGGGGKQYTSGGGGGALAYRNNIAVTPGEVIAIVVGAGGARFTGSTSTPGGLSSFANGIANKQVRAGGGGSKYGTGTNTVDSPGGADVVNGTTGAANAIGGGGFGGKGSNGGAGNYGGGGGAGGYTGAGGNAGENAAGGAGAGGGGGGGADGSGDATAGAGGGGGGVGIFGQGANGAGGQYNVNVSSINGKGGSGGGNATVNTGSNNSDGGLYGGGGGAAGGSGTRQGAGGGGAVRILWGAGRAFPSTNVSTATN